MGLHVIEIDEFPDLFLKKWLVLLAIFVMADTLLSKRTVKAFDVCLLVLLVRTSGTVTFAMKQDFIVTLGFEPYFAKNTTPARLRKSDDATTRWRFPGLLLLLFFSKADFSLLFLQ